MLLLILHAHAGDVARQQMHAVEAYALGHEEERLLGRAVAQAREGTKCDHVVGEYTALMQHLGGHELPVSASAKTVAQCSLMRPAACSMHSHKERHRSQRSRIRLGTRTRRSRCMLQDAYCQQGNSKFMHQTMTSLHASPAALCAQHAAPTAMLETKVASLTQ
ncbi:hypothetical protein DFH07DRAFT_341812 [Mycena maculata]|uniref:Uncharacterized protein n=1 Tax=Mycena maculata TaxID=230809 RepID=A0AAD7HCE7_9AGAR|nr:hypothetical protein DFH07DRAFT_341812 [Mycena maculata]